MDQRRSGKRREGGLLPLAALSAALLIGGLGAAIPNYETKKLAPAASLSSVAAAGEPAGVIHASLFGPDRRARHPDLLPPASLFPPATPPAAQRLRDGGRE